VTTTAATSPAPPNALGVPSYATLVAVAITVTAWASAFVAIRGVRHAFDPGALALGRLLIGSVALGAAVLVRHAWVRPSRLEWALVVVCGIAWFAIYNVALNAAERRVDAGTAAMLVNVGPILIALLAGALLSEGFPRWLLAGAGVAFAGAMLIGVATTQRTASDLGGIALCLGAALAWAIGVLAQKPALRRLPALQVTWMSCAVGAIACLPFSGQLIRDAPRASGQHLAGLIYLGLIPTSIAFCTWAYALSRMPAGRLGVTTYLVPPLTIAIAWPVLGEWPPLLALLGGAIALAGVSLSRRRAT
jgi:drug/metabolite transporter (DMT)-like permease